MASCFRYGGFLFLFALLLLTKCSEKEKKKPDPVLVTISGTNVSLIPPSGFAQATDIPGLRHGSLLASIIVLETPKAYEHVMADVSKARMTEQGITLLSIDTVSIPGLKGTLYKTLSHSEGLSFLQWVLVLPVQGHTVSVNGTFSRPDEAALSEHIKEALLSTRIAANTSSKDMLTFTIDSDSLQLAKILAGPSVIFTGNGKWNDSAIFDLSFFAGPFKVEQAPVRLEEFTLNQLKGFCTDCEVIKNGIQPITIDSLSGYEVVAISKDSAGVVKRLKYEVVLFDSLQYYLLVGTSTKNSRNRVEMFKEISRSFKRKV
jgi:hypothetical protein